MAASPGDYTSFDVLSVAFFSFFSSLVYATTNTLLPSAAKRYAGETVAETLGWVFALGALSDVAGLCVCAASDRTSPSARFGRRLPYIAGGMALSLAGFFAFLSAQSLQPLIVGFLLAVTGLSCACTIGHSLITEVLPSAQSARASTAVSVFGLIGSSFGLAAVALGGFSSALLATAVASVPAVLSLVFQARAVSRAVARFQQLQQEQQQLSSAGEGAPCAVLSPDATGLLGFAPQKHVDFLMCLGMRVFANAGLSSLSFIQLFLSDCVGIKDEDLPRTMGVLALVTQGASLAFALPATRLADKYGKRWPMSAGLLLVSVALPVLSHVQTHSSAFIVALIFGIGCGLFYALEIGVVYDSMPSKRNGAKHLGLSLISCTVGTLFGEKLCGSLLQRHKGAVAGSFAREGYGVIFGVSALLSLVAMVFCFLINPKRARAARKAFDIDGGLLLAQSPALVLQDAPPLQDAPSSPPMPFPSQSPRPLAFSSSAIFATPPRNSMHEQTSPPPSQQQQQQQQSQQRLSPPGTAPPRVFRNTSMPMLSRQLSGPLHIKLPRAIAVLDTLDQTTPPASPKPQRRVVHTAVPFSPSS